MSIKSLLVVAWACLVAGAAVASENQRLCLEQLQTRTELDGLHEYFRPTSLETESAEEPVLIITQVDVTN